jgi:hypothetical protein
VKARRFGGPLAPAIQRGALFWHMGRANPHTTLLNRFIGIENAHSEFRVKDGDFVRCITG